MGSLHIDNRRARLLEHVPLSSRFLEIGPYDQPTLQKSECDVRYLDYQTRAELAAAVADPKQAAAIPETDYLVRSDVYTDSVSDRFDAVIANHVFEHVPNPIAWLRLVHGMLHDDGVLFMALPDKKYTFDKYRPDTAFSHLLHDYFADVKVASHEHLLEDAMYYDMEFIGKPMRMADRLDPERLRAVMSRQPHLGLHCHVFQSETFLAKVLRPILFMQLVAFAPIGFYPASDNHGEFIVVLRKRNANVDIDPAEFFTTDFAAPPAASSVVSRVRTGVRQRLHRWLRRR